MAKLTAAKRNALPASDFAVAGRKFPVNDRNHARDALARVADKSPKERAEVKSKVKAKFPDMDAGTGKNQPKGKEPESTGVPRGDHYKAGQRAPDSHAEFSNLGSPKDGKYC